MLMVAIIIQLWADRPENKVQPLFVARYKNFANGTRCLYKQSLKNSSAQAPPSPAARAECSAAAVSTHWPMPLSLVAKE